MAAECDAEDEKLRLFIEKEITRRGEARVFPVDYQGRKIWVKRAEKVRNEAWLRFSRALCVKFGLSMLQPGADPNGGKAVRFEAGRMRRLKKRGVPVPVVCASGADWLAMENAGRNLIDVLGEAKTSRKEKEDLICKAAELLAAFHAQGIHHGRPALKDMAYDGERVVLLDFEDGVMLRVGRRQRLWRDLLLFLQSVVKETDPQLAEIALAAYREKHPALAQEAVAHFGSFKGLYLFFKYVLRHMGSDLETTYQVLGLFHKEDF